MELSPLGSDEAGAALAGLPSTRRELQDSIDEKSAQADGIVCGNPAALDDYRRWAPGPFVLLC